MTTRRIFWRLARPIVAVANRIGLCSYKWVNVCVLAWRRDLGDALMHHEHFGDPVDAWPMQLVLQGIAYETVVAHVDSVVLVEEFTRRRMAFRRNSALTWEVDTSLPDLCRSRVPGVRVDRGRLRRFVPARIRA